ncbi:MAG: electron transfer flavoprotein subunit beta/FixA family protein [Gammaproteobacteria bacterium]|nr:electron transfer flavoprotein subunit beta/FixA family protein [Gammaproteobacteria bacterium]
MKALVAVKRVVDPYVKIHLKPDGSAVDLNSLKMVMNPFDEIALEEALRLREQGKIQEVIAVSLGSVASQETLRHALALGADSAILIQTDAWLYPLITAKLLAALAGQLSPQLIMLGKQAIDSDNNQVGQMLAGLLNWPQGTFVSRVTMEADRLVVKREIDTGLETLSLQLPAVLTSDLRLNTPRYATLPNIVKAKQKPLSVMTPEQLQVVMEAPHYEVIKVEMPRARKSGVKLNSVAELIEKLKTEAKVL